MIKVKRDNRPRYRRVSTRWRSDEKVRKLSAPPPNAQTLWMELLCGEHTSRIPGLLAVGRGGLADTLGWDLEGLDRVWAEIAEQGMARADWSARLIWLPNAFRHNPPESPSVAAAWASDMLEMPECNLLDEAAASIEAALAAKGSAWLAAWLAVFDPARQSDAQPGGQAGAGADGHQEQEAGTGTGEEERSSAQAPSAPAAPAASLDEPVSIVGMARAAHAAVVVLEPEVDDVAALEGVSQPRLAAQTQPIDPIVLTIPTSGKDAGEWRVLASFVAEMEDAYPRVDVREELRRMRAWSVANPRQRKTAAGMARFINAWLAKAQDRGGSPFVGQARAGPARGGGSVAERLAQAAAEAAERERQT